MGVPSVDTSPQEIQRPRVPPPDRRNAPRERGAHFLGAPALDRAQENERTRSGLESGDEACRIRIRRQGFGSGHQQVLGRAQRSRPRVAAQCDVPDRVSRDLEEPGAETIGTAKAPDVPPRRKEGGLPRVLGVLAKAKHPHEVEEERPRELRVEIGECGAISGLRAFDEGESGVHPLR